MFSQPLQIISFLYCLFKQKTPNDLIPWFIQASVFFFPEVCILEEGGISIIAFLNTIWNAKSLMLYISLPSKSRWLQYVIVSLTFQLLPSADRKCYSLCECQQQPIISPMMCVGMSRLAEHALLGDENFAFNMCACMGLTKNQITSL